MYKGKKQITKRLNDKCIVSFCKDCNSQNIECIYTCKDCGSHHIQLPVLNPLAEGYDDPRSYKQSIITEEVNVFICDICKQEYVLKLQESHKANSIYLLDGQYTISYPDYYDYAKTVTFTEDICPNCLHKIIDKLNEQLDQVVSNSNVMSIKDELYNSTHNS